MSGARLPVSKRSVKEGVDGPGGGSGPGLPSAQGLRAKDARSGRGRAALPVLHLLRLHGQGAPQRVRRGAAQVRPQDRHHARGLRARALLRGPRHHHAHLPPRDPRARGLLRPRGGLGQGLVGQPAPGGGLFRPPGPGPGQPHPSHDRGSEGPDRGRLRRDRRRHPALLHRGPGQDRARLRLGLALHGRLRHQQLPQRHPGHPRQDERGVLLRRGGAHQGHRGGGGLPPPALCGARLPGGEAAAAQLPLRGQLRKVAARQDGGGPARGEEPQGEPGQRGEGQEAADRVQGQRRHHHRGVRGQRAHRQDPRGGGALLLPDPGPGGPRGERRGGGGQAPEGRGPHPGRWPLRSGAGDGQDVRQHRGRGHDPRAVHHLRAQRLGLDRGQPRRLPFPPCLRREEVKPRRLPLALLALPLTACGVTSSTEVGVRTSLLGVLEKRGEQQVYEPGGVYFFLPVLSAWNVLPISQQNLLMNANPGEGDRPVPDDITFKTKDGNNVYIDVNVMWRVDHLTADLPISRVRPSAGPSKERLMRPISRSVIRDLFNEITSEEYYQVTVKNRVAAKAKEELARQLAPYGILVDMLQVQQHRFDHEYQAAINAQKQAEADVQTLIEQQKNMVAQQKSGLEAKRSEWNKQLEDALGHAGRTRNDSDASYHTKSNAATPYMAAAQAEAEAVRKEAEALGKLGGDAYVKMQVAQMLSRKRIVLVPGTNVSTLDVNKMVNFLLGRGNPPEAPAASYEYQHSHTATYRA